MTPPLNEKQKDALSAMMHEALTNQAPEKLANCIRLGGDVDRTVQGSPLLHHLAHSFNNETAKILLENTANIDLRDGDGNTPLIKAIKALNSQAVAFFMEAGADPLAQNNDGEVALEIARKIKIDWTADVIKKDSIIKSLLKDHGRVAPKAADTEATEKKPITVLKPIVFHGNKKPNSPGGGFRL